MNRNQIVKKLQEWQNAANARRPIQIVWNEVKDIIQCLEEITNKGLQDDPFKNLNDTLFRQFSLALGERIGDKQLGISSFKRYYERCLELELENNGRIHKGDTLYFLGKFHYELRKFDEAFYYWILAFLDDILSEFYKTVNVRSEVCIPESLRTPVCGTLQLYFDIPIINLQNLKNNSWKVLENETDTIFDPEILKFKLRNAGRQTPRLVDYQSYHPHISYLKSIYDKAKRSSDPRLWEQFAAFLLSSIDGFEPITNLRAGVGSYEFDTIIRNCTRNEVFVSSLGDYIGVECKYLKKRKVDVEALNHFASKLKYHDMRCGIIFSKTPISGYGDDKGERYGKLVQAKIFNRNNIVIFDISENDVKRILKGTNLIELIIEKYEIVRLAL